MKKSLFYLALVFTASTYAQAPLFFSEYAEGSSSNKYLEIYNPTDSVVFLDNYAFPSASNGADVIGTYDYWNSFPENGASINPGGVYVICHSSADSSILAFANHTHNYLSNGDDGYALVYGDESNYQVLDFIGDFNEDPGTGWSVAGVDNATKDHTLVRKFSVQQGNSNWIESAGTNEEDSEWIVFDQNEWSYLGSHTDLANTLIPGCTDENATNYNPEANQDDGSCIYPELNVTIAEIQGMQDVSPYVGQMVTTTGLVVAKSESNYFLQGDSGAWNGIYVYDSNDSIMVGHRISITATVDEYYGATQLNSVQNITIITSEFTNLPTEISAEMFNTEAYEGVLVTVDMLECTASANEYGEAEFVNAANTVISDDLYFDFTPSQGSYYQVTGVVHYSFGNYKINPRSESDIVEYIVGCMDETMLNYNPNATLELEDSCLDEILGCMDMTACNYNDQATVDDNSCEYAEEYYNCEGECISDIDEDGVCDELEVYGCTDSEAMNYDASATEDDGSCEYLSLDDELSSKIRISSVNGGFGIKTENTIVQTYRVYNILGVEILREDFYKEVIVPMYGFETATYIVRVGNHSQLIVKQ